MSYPLPSSKHSLAPSAVSISFGSVLICRGILVAPNVIRLYCRLPIGKTQQIANLRHANFISDFQNYDTAFRSPRLTRFAHQTIQLALELNSEQETEI